MHERGFEREERQERLSQGYASLDRMTTMRAMGVPATLDQIIPERMKQTADEVNVEAILNEGNTQ
jgi:hypothetical protein